MTKLFGHDVHERYIYSNEKELYEDVPCFREGCNNPCNVIITIRDGEDGPLTNEQYYLCRSCHNDLMSRESHKKSQKDLKQETEWDLDLFRAQGLMERAMNVEKEFFSCARKGCSNLAEIKIVSKVSGKDTWVCKECVKDLQKDQIVYIDDTATELLWTK